jgi:hypothetical protein
MKAILSVAFARPGLAAKLAEVTKVVLDDLPEAREVLPREGKCVGHRRLLGAMSGEWEGDEDPLLVHLQADDVAAFSRLIQSKASPDFNEPHPVERVKHDFLIAVKSWGWCNARLLEIAGQFGASKCARYLLANSAEARLEEEAAAIFGGSPELVRMLDHEFRGGRSELRPADLGGFLGPERGCREVVVGAARELVDGAQRAAASFGRVSRRQPRRRARIAGVGFASTEASPSDDSRWEGDAAGRDRRGA